MVIRPPMLSPVSPVPLVLVLLVALVLVDVQPELLDLRLSSPTVTQGDRVGLEVRGVVGGLAAEGDYTIADVLMHVAEERLQVPYRRWVRRSGTVVVNGRPTRSPRYWTCRSG